MLSHRMAGYVQAIRARHDPSYGYDAGVIWYYTNKHCHGNESNLAECPHFHGWGSSGYHYCLTHSRDVSLLCDGELIIGLGNFNHLLLVLVVSPTLYQVEDG